MDWSSLPKPALHVLMQLVPKRQRIGSSTFCGLVCKSWAAAAAALLEEAHSIDIGYCRDTGSLQLWLSRHGSVVTSLSIQSGRSPLASLPCPELQDLQLEHCLLICSQLFIDLAAATKLTSLKLTSVRMDCSTTQFLALLTSLTALEQLTVCNVRAEGGVYVEVSCTDLLHLPRLTCLKLTFGPSWTGSNGLYALNKLQRLDLKAFKYDYVSVNKVAMPAAMVQLQALSQLTALRMYLGTVRLTVGVTAERLSGLIRLSALESLDLAGSFYLHPSAFSGLTQLHHLHLSGADVICAVDFLAALGQMRQLTRLALCDVVGLQAAPLASYSALTASSKLQLLQLGSVILSVPELASLDSFFSSDQQRLQLTALHLSSTQYVLSQQQFEAVLQACPALKQLDIMDVINRDVQATALVRLSALTTDAEVVGNIGSTITQLSRLRSLVIADDISDAHLQQLTALQQLTYLRFGDGELTDHMHQALTRLPGADHDEELGLFEIVTEAPDLWQKLVTACS